MLKKGDQAPEFSLPDESGQLVTLARLLEQAPLILYFYPADFTPICTAEACSIRDMHGDILDVDMQVVGISPQSSSSHTKFKDEFNLPFPLLFDDSKRVIRSYGADGILGMGVRRATFLVNQDGKIENLVVSDLFVSSHVSFIKQVIAGRAA
ncbi:MAG: peroxiredoxin Q/BCP [Candidatus Azotimanducaceae bacterium]|jgi:peroxiredoxin Q/BCP